MDGCIRYCSTNAITGTPEDSRYSKMLQLPHSANSSFNGQYEASCLGSPTRMSFYIFCSRGNPVTASTGLMVPVSSPNPTSGSKLRRILVGLVAVVTSTMSALFRNTSCAVRQAFCSRSRQSSAEAISSTSIIDNLSAKR